MNDYQQLAWQLFIWYAVLPPVALNDESLATSWQPVTVQAQEAEEGSGISQKVRDDTVSRKEDIMAVVQWERRVVEGSEAWGGGAVKTVDATKHLPWILTDLIQSLSRSWIDLQFVDHRQAC